MCWRITSSCTPQQRSQGASLGVLELRIGDELTVRFLHDGNAYGFVSDVMNLTRVPDEFVFLRYPQMIEHVSVRRHRRLGCRLPCNLVTGNGEKARAALLDISEGGLKVASRAFRDSGQDAGTVVTIELTLPDTAGGVRELIGEIIRAEEQPQAVVAGIKFKDQQPELIKTLSEFLYLDGSYSRENDEILDES